MRFLHLPLLYCMLSIFGPYQMEPSPASVSESTTATTSVDALLGAANIIFQSKDGGQTWQDISRSLPDGEQPLGFFAGESDIYLRAESGMYRSNSNLKSPVWEKQDFLDPKSTSIAFNPSGVMAYNQDGQVYKKTPFSETWSPIYPKSKGQLETIFEAANGAVFLGTQTGLYKSIDKGKSWKQVLKEGWVMDIVESQGVLIGTGQKGIMRSTDNGEHWEWVISEGGVGIAVERIDNGFAAISYSAQTKTRRIRISVDGGKNWKAIDEHLPPSLSISSIKQMGSYLLCGHPDGIFRSSDHGRTWSLVHSSVEALQFIFVANTTNRKVFKIFASGKTLYAVASPSGC